MKYGKHAKREDDKKKEDRFTEKSKKLWIGLIILIIIVIITAITILVVHKITYTQEYANKKMTQLVTKYFEEDIKDNVVGVGRLIVTLQTLKDAGFNIKGVKGKPGVSEDLSKAFSYIIIENPEETDTQKVIYTIENHLNGE